MLLWNFFLFNYWKKNEIAGMLNAFLFPAKLSQALLFSNKIEQRIISILLNYRFQTKKVQSLKYVIAHERFMQEGFLVSYTIWLPVITIYTLFHIWSQALREKMYFQNICIWYEAKQSVGMMKHWISLNISTDS